ncbi:MAG: type II secretion system major pseudopilin GspG [Candidatus Omnitrophica bacterium]|nr:type II secretion system major pseudopilin GspG [Candidatus Omnitrophota bacterium]
MSARDPRVDSRLRTQDSRLGSWVLGLGSQQAFTLVELMLVVVIIGVLAAMVVPRLAGRSEQAKISRAKSDVASIGLALDLYELDMGSFPTGTSLDPLYKGDSLPSGANTEAWKGPYLKKQVQDPWGREYQYKYPSESGEKDYDLFSLGPDGQAGTEDDIKN